MSVKEIPLRLLLLTSSLGAAIVGGAFVGGFRGVGYVLLGLGVLCTFITVVNIAVDGLE